MLVVFDGCRQSELGGGPRLYTIHTFSSVSAHILARWKGGCTPSWPCEGKVERVRVVWRRWWLAVAVPGLHTAGGGGGERQTKLPRASKVELRVAVSFFVHFPIPQLVKPGETSKKESIQNPGALRVDFPFGLDASHTAELSPASIGSLLALLHDVHPTHTSIPVLLHMRENWLNEPKSG